MGKYVCVSHVSFSCLRCTLDDEFMMEPLQNFDAFQQQVDPSSRRRRH